MCRSALVVTALWIGLGFPAPTQGSEWDPRPLSGADRAAVEILLAQIEGNSDAIDARIAPDSPLASLSAEDRSAWLDLLLTPAPGTQWVLSTPLEAPPTDGLQQPVILVARFASGLEETFFLDLESEGGEWKLRDLRSWAQPVAEGSASATPALALGMLLVVALCHRRKQSWRILPAAAGVLVVLGCGPTQTTDETDPSAMDPSAMQVPPGPIRVSPELRELRRQVTDSSSNAASVREALEALRGDLGESLARTWAGHHALLVDDSDAALAITEPLPESLRTPALSVLRARLALLHLDENRVAETWEQALSSGPVWDELAMEAMSSLAIMGWTHRAEELDKRLRESGTRNAEIQYNLARFAAVDRRISEGVERFRIAWRLRPRERADVLTDPILVWLALEGSAFDLLRISEPSEPVWPMEDAGLEPLETEAGAFLIGEELHLEWGATEMVIAGGAGFAPKGAESLDAKTVRVKREESLLDKLPSLLSQTQSAASILQPGLREEVSGLAIALARRNRWSDVDRLGQGWGDAPDRMPPVLAMLKGEALKRLGRKKEALALLATAIRNRRADDRPDPGIFYRLSGILTELGRPDLALKSALQAERQSPIPRPDLLARLRAEVRFQERYVEHESDHFSIRFPPETSVGLILETSELLETELDRLQTWIDWRPKEKIAIDLLPFSDFLQHFSLGGTAIGLFDGRIRVPFAQVSSLPPIFERILSHELVHAMLTPATAGHAPAWFQEGLAQHLELGAQGFNPIADLAAVNRLISVPLLEPVLVGRSSPQLVETAYNESMWLVNYIENQHGRASLRGLIGAFRDGRTTDEAIGEILGLSMVELDEMAWTWCQTKAPRYREPQGASS